MRRRAEQVAAGERLMASLVLLLLLEALELDQTDADQEEWLFGARVFKPRAIFFTSTLQR